ncbi:MAG: stalk domain-containing protein [Bacillota bacterium]|nr:stalk domain-containing protein [Bacillota bacterium]
MRRTKISKLLSLFLILVCFSFNLNLPVNALALQTFISMKVNDNFIKTDAPPYIKNERTYVSLRFVAEALGADVSWVESEKKVLVVTEKSLMELFAGKKEILINGDTVNIDAAVELNNGHTMVPIRFVSENLGCKVEWDPKSYTLNIKNDKIVIPKSLIYTRNYTDEDLLWLARIIHVEGKGLSINAKVAIANVVLNRKNNPAYPNTIKGVIFQKGEHTQFPPAFKSGFTELIPTQECFAAAKMAFEGVNNIGKCLFFCDVPFKSKRITLYKKIDGMYFYY